MVIWFSDTSLPRMAVGDISAMYMGESADAMPMPMPPTKRAMLKRVKSSNHPVATADTVKNTAAMISSGLRPYLSASMPAMVAPARHPMSAVVMATPCIRGESEIPK